MPGWAAFWKGHTMPLKVSSVATCSQRRDTACSHREGKLILVLRKSPAAGTFLCTSMDYMRPHISLQNLVSDMCADPGAVRIPSLGRLEQAYPLLLRIFLLMTNKTGFYQNSPWQTKRFWGFLCLHSVVRLPHKSKVYLKEAALESLYVAWMMASLWLCQRSLLC